MIQIKSGISYSLRDELGWRRFDPTHKDSLGLGQNSNSRGCEELLMRVLQLNIWARYGPYAERQPRLRVQVCGIGRAYSKPRFPRRTSGQESFVGMRDVGELAPDQDQEHRRPREREPERGGEP